MAFDSLRMPPERDPPRRHEEPERALRPRDRVVFVVVAVLLALVTLANCRLLLGYWHESHWHESHWHDAGHEGVGHG